MAEWRGHCRSLRLDRDALTELFIDNNAITDLSPLKGMALTQLVCLTMRLRIYPRYNKHRYTCWTAGKTPSVSWPHSPAWRFANCTVRIIALRICLPSPSPRLSYWNAMIISSLTLPPYAARHCELQCGGNAINDLSPLRGMRLSSLLLVQQHS